MKCPNCRTKLLNCHNMSVTYYCHKCDKAFKWYDFVLQFKENKARLGDGKC